MKIRSFILNTIPYLLSFVVNAAPASTVYRLDYRPPEVIFEEGFTSWGGELEILHHFSGELEFDSEEKPQDGFISTSESRETALEHASTMNNPFNPENDYPEDGTVTFYLYEIRADDRFYDLDASMAAEIERLKAAGQLERARTIQWYLNSYGGLSEVIAVSHIPGSMIISATEVILRTDDMGNLIQNTLQEGIGQSNAGFIDSGTHVNDNLWDMSGESSPPLVSGHVVPSVDNHSTQGAVDADFLPNVDCSSEEQHCVPIGFSGYGVAPSSPDRKSVINLPYVIDYGVRYLIVI